MKYILISLLAAVALHAQTVTNPPNVQVTLQWDRNPEPDIAAYRMWIGANGTNFLSSTNLGTNITYTYTARPPQTNWFAVSAVNQFGLESGLSERLRVIVAAPKIPNPPRIQSYIIGR